MPTRFCLVILSKSTVVIRPRISPGILIFRHFTEDSFRDSFRDFSITGLLDKRLLSFHQGFFPGLRQELQAEFHIHPRNSSLISSGSFPGFFHRFSPGYLLRSFPQFKVLLGISPENSTLISAVFALRIFPRLNQGFFQEYFPAFFQVREIHLGIPSEMPLDLFRESFKGIFRDSLIDFSWDCYSDFSCGSVHIFSMNSLIEPFRGFFKYFFKDSYMIQTRI